MKKTISIVLSLLMLVTMLPSFAISAFAAEKLATPTININGSVYSISADEDADDFYFSVYDSSDNVAFYASSSTYDYEFSLVGDKLKRGETYRAEVYCADREGVYENSDKATLVFTYDPYAFGYGNQQRTITYSFDNISKTLTFTLCSDPRGYTRVNNFGYCQSAFYKSTDIAHVVFGEGITELSNGSYPFYQATVQDITIPASMTFVGSDFVRELNVLVGWHVAAENTRYRAIDDSLYECTSTKTLVHYVQGSATSFTTPSDLNVIGRHAFTKYVNLDTLTLDGDNLEIVDYGLDHPTINNIVVTDNVKEIRSFCSIYGWAPTSITIPASVTSWAVNSFLDDASVVNINVDADNANYASVDGVLFSKDLKSILMYPNGKTETTYNVPDGTTTIGRLAFANTHLEQINLPASVTHINPFGFEYSNSFQRITISGLDVEFDSQAIWNINPACRFSVYEGSKTEINLIKQGIDTSKIDYISCTEHNYQLVKTVEPSCFAEGYDLNICSICGKENKTNITAMTPHEVKPTYSNDKTIEYHMCKNHEKTEIITTDLPESAHNYENYTDTSIVYSFPRANTITFSFDEFFATEVNCDYVAFYDKNDIQLAKFSGVSLANDSYTVTGDYVKFVFHSDSSVNDYGYKVTSIVVEYDGCTYEEPSTAHVHDYGEYVSDGNATCIADGTETATCDCGEFLNRTEEGSALGHDYVITGTATASCSIEGANVYTCTRCGDSYNEPVAMIAHDMTSYYDSVNDKDVTECTRHQEFTIETNINLPETAHPYANSESQDYVIHFDGATKITLNFSSASETEGACDPIDITDKNFVKVRTLYGTIGAYSLDVPGDTVNIHFKSDSSIVRYGFSFDSVVVTYPGCGVSNAVDHVHNYEFKAVNTAPTCTAKGNDTYECTICHATELRETAALGHSFTSYVSNEDATCTLNCTETASCDNGCGETDTRDIANSKLPHSGGTATCTEKAICSSCGAEYGELAPHDLITLDPVLPTCTTSGLSTGKKCNNCDYEIAQVVIPATGHTVVTDSAVAPTCTASGLTEGSHCSVCSAVIVSQNTVAALGHSFGDNLQACTVCGTANPSYVAPAPTPADPTPTPADPTPDVIAPAPQQTVEQKVNEIAGQYGVSADTLALNDSAVTSAKGDADLKGSDFGKLQLKQAKADKTSIKISWSKVAGADGYIVYSAKCGSKLKKVKTVKAGTTSYTQKKLKKGTYYKFVVVAYKDVDGQKVTLAASKTIHATTAGGKYGNPKSVKLSNVKKNKLTIKKGKTFTVKVSQVKADKTIKKHTAIKFETSNKAIATVDSKGKISAKKKGTCKVYVYAQNGVSQTITVTVK